MSKYENNNRTRIVNAFGFILRPFLTTPQMMQDYSPEAFANLEVWPGEYLFKFSAEQSDFQMIAEIHDLGFLVRERGVEATWDYLTKTVIPILREQREIVTRQPEKYTVVPYSEIIFMSPLLEEEREREEIALALNKDEGPLTDIASCQRCPAKKVHRKVAQTRSADEGMTSIFKCPDCRFGWSEN